MVCILHSTFMENLVSSPNSNALYAVSKGMGDMKFIRRHLAEK